MIHTQFKIERTLVRFLSLILLSPLCALGNGSDDFDDNSKDTTKWGNDVVTGGFGVLTEQNQRLEFTVNNVLTDGNTFRPWILEGFPVNANWTIQVDLFNSTAPAASDQFNGGGFTLFHPTNPESKIFLEQYATDEGKGFFSNLETDDNNVGAGNTGAIFGPTVMGAVRMEYDSMTRVITSFRDADTSDGYQWTQLASFGLDNSGGADGNTDWNLSAAQQFSVSVFGFAELMTVASGELFLDNFVSTGGVPPVAGPDLMPSITNVVSNCSGGPCLLSGDVTLKNNGIPYAEASFDFTAECKNCPDKVKWKLAGLLTIGNLDTTGVPDHDICLYLSDDDTFDGGDTLLVKKPIGLVALASGFLKGKAVKIKAKPPAGVDLSGKFLILAADCSEIVAESDESNNAVAIGPIQ